MINPNYKARLVVIGKTGENPFVGFVLASRSLAYREMRIKTDNKASKIYIMPREGHEADNITNPDVDNYACIIGKKIQKIKRVPGDITGSLLQDILANMKKYVMVSFNGHMCKRCIANVEDGMRPEIALDSTLFEFRGLHEDPRIGGLVYVDEDFEMGFIGVNDTDRLEKRVRGYKLDKNNAIYTYCADTSLDHRVKIPEITKADELALFITREMIPNSEKILAGGVCILKRGQFETGNYNVPVDEINKWAKK